MNEAQLQQLLTVYRHRQTMPVLGRRPANRRWWLATAAAVLVAVVFAAWPLRNDGWIVKEGPIRRMLRPGETISTAGRGTRLESRAVGVVDVGADTVIRFGGGARLSLARGTIHARTTSPPGIFVVDTPHATAIDLGCEYVLSISPTGGGELRVSAGWVQLQQEGLQTLVPQGAHAAISSDGRITPPIFEDASLAFQAAIARGDLSTALPLARRRDALTLLSLLRSVTPDDRLRVYDRLNALVPAPPTVPRDAMKTWTIGTTDAWWSAVLKASGVQAIKKKKGMLRGLWHSETATHATREGARPIILAAASVSSM